MRTGLGQRGTGARSRSPLSRPPSPKVLAAERRVQPSRIHIRGLAARTIIGLKPDERHKRQDLSIDLVLDTHGRAGRTDRLADAVDYKRVKDLVLRHVEASRYRLLEALAESIAEVVLAEPGVDAVQVTVDKPSALRFARSVAVEVQRSRRGAATQTDAEARTA